MSIMCFIQVYVLDVTWSDGLKSQTEVDDSSLADWRVGSSVGLLKPIPHRQYVGRLSGDVLARLGLSSGVI